MDEQVGMQVPAVEPTPQRGGFGKLVGMFFEPSAVLRELAVKPSWVWPVVLLMVVTLATQLVIAPRLDMAGTIRERMERSGRQISEEQLEQAVAMGGKIARISMYASPLFVPITLLMLAGVYALGLRVLGGDVDFGKLFAGISHAVMPSMLVASALMMVVAWPRDAITGTQIPHLVRSGLGSWLGPDVHRAVAAAADILDIFNIWQWVLVVLALEIMGKLKRNQAIGLVAVVWGAWTVVKVGLAFLQ
jgi:hypothetical protein